MRDVTCRVLEFVGVFAARGAVGRARFSSFAIRLGKYGSEGAEAAKAGLEAFGASGGIVPVIVGWFGNPFDNVLVSR